MKEKILENIFIIIAGICLIIYSSITLSKLLSYKRVIAECVDTNGEWFFTSDTASKGYRSKYKFNLNNKEIIASESNYLGAKTKIHQKYNIFVNTNNPTKILTIPQIISHIVFAVFGVIIIMISIL